jgi:hypothetical protein
VGGHHAQHVEDVGVAAAPLGYAPQERLGGREVAGLEGCAALAQQLAEAGRRGLGSGSHQRKIW